MITILIAVPSTPAARSGAAPLADETGFSHGAWARVLEQVVDERGRVDYDALAQSRVELDRYIDAIQSISPDTHPARFPDPDQELAYWINAYNAQTFLGVLDLGTDIDSVWAGLISGRNFFVKRKITVGGERMNLKSLEDDIVRKRYGDPRIHAALNCASIGCPRLPQEPFLGATLDTQLDAAMREFVNSTAHVRFDEASNTAHLSKIFDWFEKDFLDFEKRHGATTPSLLGYINRYRDTAIPADAGVDFLRYDKGLNRQ